MRVRAGTNWIIVKWFTFKIQIEILDHTNRKRIMIPFDQPSCCYKRTQTQYSAQSYYNVWFQNSNTNTSTVQTRTQIQIQMQLQIQKLKLNKNTKTNLKLSPLCLTACSPCGCSASLHLAPLHSQTNPDYYLIIWTQIRPILIIIWWLSEEFYTQIILLLFEVKPILVKKKFWQISCLYESWSDQSC